jgi:hypothetical protein
VAQPIICWEGFIAAIEASVSPIFIHSFPSADHSTYSYSSPGTASGLLLDTDISFAGSAAGNLADVATFAIAVGLRWLSPGSGVPEALDYEGNPSIAIAWGQRREQSTDAPTGKVLMMRRQDKIESSEQTESSRSRGETVASQPNSDSSQLLVE